MSILTAATEPFDHNDQEAIADLHAAIACQRAAFAEDRAPDLPKRRCRLEALIAMMLTHREAIGDALIADFGAHPRPASDLIEVFGVVGRAQYVPEHLEEWMRPEPRDADPAIFGTARASVQRQPKGVIGNIVPWNFPFDLSVGPLVEMLAAGNRVVIKPSEYTPARGTLLRRMIAEAFDPGLVHVVVGGRVLSKAFAASAWDHLLYTGSPAVGREVMAAAARNLTPVTLELGGKCPALLAPGMVDSTSVGSVIGTKLIKNGQMCVSVDYAFVHRAEIEAFARLARAYMDTLSPSYSNGDDRTRIISGRHAERLQGLLDEAAARQTRIVPLEEPTPIDPIDPPAELKMMREEIFGPILPVVPYDDLDDAIAAITAGDRPLGLYIFAEEGVAGDVISRTHSGGVTVNGCAMQSALPSPGFGGSGMSGIGRHHGIDGVREFSNARGVGVRGSGDTVDAFYPPYTRAAALVQAALP